MDKLPAEVFNGLLDQLESRGGRDGPTTNPRRNPWALPQPYRPDHIDSRQHFSALRLVCRRFNELTAPYLFRSIGLRFNQKSFKRLESLAANPQLSKHVRKFVYLMPYLYEEGIQDFEAFRNDQTLGLSNKSRAIMFEEHEPYYYTSALAEQTLLMRDSYDLKVLTKAFSAFTQLQEVNLLAIMVHKDIVLRNLASSYDNWAFTDCKWIPACRHAVETLTQAMFTANSPVTTLCSPTMSPQSLISMSPHLRNIAHKTWQQFTYLEFTYDERPDRSYLDTSGTVLTGHNNAIKSMFTHFLHPATNLSTLYIRFTPGMPVRIPLSNAFASLTFPKLRNLGIGSWMLHAAEIIDLVTRHRRTLTGLRLNEVYLLDGDRWHDVVVAVKELLPRIDWVHLCDISYERQYVRKQAYIETYSDTSEEDAVSYDDEDSLDRLSLRSASSGTESADAGALGADDVVYGNIFAAGGAGGGLGGAGGVHGLVGLLARQEMEEEEEGLEDDGRTVSQAQRRHWERWIVGEWPRGTRYKRPL